jgi:hypothetical protein
MRDPEHGRNGARTISLKLGARPADQKPTDRDRKGMLARP